MVLTARESALSEGDFEKWETRYSQASPTESVDPFFDAIADKLPGAGRALDIAGGSGRHALFLARRGLDVTLVDISPAGLAIARETAESTGLSITTRALDLEVSPLPEETFDVVVCTWFLLSKKLWSQAVERLRVNGLLVYVQPTTTNLERNPHPSRRFLLEPGSLENTVTTLNLETVQLEEGWDTRGHYTARLLARKCS